MVGNPNDMLASVGSSMKATEIWVAKKVSAHISFNNVNIRFRRCRIDPRRAITRGVGHSHNCE
ncbi:hypothetical protein CRYUN_Cryun34aG0102200 [Craigia yunnanensis]